MIQVSDKFFVGRSMSLVVLSSLAMALASFPAIAVEDAHLNAQLMRLDRATRLEQTCDIEVMSKLTRTEPKVTADKVIAYTFDDPVVSHNTIKADGAVFRSGGEWYRLSYFCRTGSRHLDAHELNYRIGEKVPREDWRRLNLYD